MEQSIRLKFEGGKTHFEPRLPASKSISNRVLIVQKLATEQFQVKNLSTANDTSVLLRGLSSNNPEINVEDAGTAMRFLLAYFFIAGKEIQLSGTKRMHMRPIGPLVNALETLGAQIKYLGEPGYLPLQVKEGGYGKIKDNIAVLDTSLSSQFISALLLISPVLPNGLVIKVEGEKVSWPYVEMTLSIMKHFGVSVDVSENVLTIKPQPYKAKDITIESDWSSAAFWYAWSTLDDCTIILNGLYENSIQGDIAATWLFDALGVETSFLAGQTILRKTSIKSIIDKVDFKAYPDLFMPYAVAAAAQKRKVYCKGLKALEYKESNRIEAMRIELSKFGVALSKVEEGLWLLDGSNFRFRKGIEIDSHNDHRIIMSFAPLCILGEITINGADAVNKSYPNFWEDCRNTGAEVKDLM